MDTLTEQTIIGLMREEWQKKLLQLEKSLNAYMKSGEERKWVIGKGTKIKHTSSGLLYTVTGVSKHSDDSIPNDSIDITSTDGVDITLSTPEGEQFTVSDKELQSEYELA